MSGPEEFAEGVTRGTQSVCVLVPPGRYVGTGGVCRGCGPRRSESVCVVVPPGCYVGTGGVCRGCGRRRSESVWWFPQGAMSGPEEFAEGVARGAQSLLVWWLPQGAMSGPEEFAEGVTRGTQSVCVVVPPGRYVGTGGVCRVCDLRHSECLCGGSPRALCRDRRSLPKVWPAALRVCSVTWCPLPQGAMSGPEEFRVWSRGGSPRALCRDRRSLPRAWPAALRVCLCGGSPGRYVGTGGVCRGCDPRHSECLCGGPPRALCRDRRSLLRAWPAALRVCVVVPPGRYVGTGGVCRGRGPRRSESVCVVAPQGAMSGPEEFAEGVTRGTQSVCVVVPPGRYVGTGGVC